MGVFLRSMSLLRGTKRANKGILVGQERQVTSSEWLRRRRFGRYEQVLPCEVVPEPPLSPSVVHRPEYSAGGLPAAPPAAPVRWSAQQSHRLRASCRLARDVLDRLAPLVQVGVTTEALNCAVRLMCEEAGAYPSPLSYRGFPKAVCTSVNNVACHGIPDTRPLREGDIVNVDITVYFDGFHGDCSDTFLVGEVDEQGQELVHVTRQCLEEAIKVCGPGVPFRAIGDVIQDCASRAKLTVVPAFVGHGIGTFFHGPPDIYHFRNKQPGVMEAGMAFTIEPVVAQGSEEVLLLEDGWTAVMVDDGRAAQAEHTVLITPSGADVLTAQGLD